MKAFWILLTLVLLALLRTKRTVAILLTNELVCLYLCYCLAWPKSFCHGNAVVNPLQWKPRSWQFGHEDIWSIKLFSRIYSNKRSVQATGVVFCVVVACFIYLLGKFGCDGVIFVGVIIKNTLLVKVNDHTYIHYPVTLRSTQFLMSPENFGTTIIPAHQGVSSLLPGPSLSGNKIAGAALRVNSQAQALDLPNAVPQFYYWKGRGLVPGYQGVSCSTFEITPCGSICSSSSLTLSRIGKGTCIGMKMANSLASGSHTVHA